jgi:hypothetical protein
VFCFGLGLMEMISAEMLGPHSFSLINRLLNKGYKLRMLNSIEDELLRDILSKALEEDP